jgi:hypothetical protein
MILTETLAVLRFVEDVHITSVKTWTGPLLLASKFLPIKYFPNTTLSQHIPRVDL